jgi:hypothetical protein
VLYIIIIIIIIKVTHPSEKSLLALLLQYTHSICVCGVMVAVMRMITTMLAMIVEVFVVEVLLLQLLVLVVV